MIFEIQNEIARTVRKVEADGFRSDASVFCFIKDTTGSQDIVLMYNLPPGFSIKVLDSTE